MIIKVTGCNNCPFKAGNTGLGRKYCSLDTQTTKKGFDIGNKKFTTSWFLTQIPKECPAKQGESFTIEIK